ncbi:nac domain-containing 104 [Olea europaea subsp. europaea]|uniref:Nac domain-containing 104 n=1 Tax=Olea europaea subsp. europaea TaxID=158383 RepID=A0A8S0PX81_OLEEU|nr:nac domain-containing 104 [Olea europaea subsp. europaea]CAA2986366.1 nac domain-containing 104 [Olea europaea subsp. europaea]
MGDNNFNLPPGFRFNPSDEELVVHFLHRKASPLPYHPDIIPDLDLRPYDPWELDGKAMREGNKWYYYSRRTQTRITGSGYWQSLGVDEPIYSSAAQKVGMKKCYAFYMGESPQGVKTNWIMQEFGLSDSSSSRRRSSKMEYSTWVVCRVQQYNNNNDDDDSTELSCLDEVFLSFDDLDEISLPK